MRVRRRVWRHPRASQVHDRLVEGLGRELAQRVLDILGPGRIVRLPRRLHETRAERRKRLIDTLETESYRDAAEIAGHAVSLLEREGKQTVTDKVQATALPI